MLLEFKDAIRAVGYEPPVNIAVGKVTRFSTNGKKNDRSGWAHVFEDGLGGTFGDWRTGDQHTWQAKRNYIQDPNEQEQMRKQFEESKRKAAIERDHEYANAATEAQALFDAARPVTRHDYLINKNIQPNMAKVFGGKLLIPVYNENGHIQSIQSIFSDGAKRFHTGGKMTGGHCWLGDPNTSDTLLIAEGFATADSLQQATKFPVCIAFTSGNLKNVTDMILKQYTDKRIIICADNDSHGVGLKEANKCGVEVVSPSIEGDFNDLMQLSGLEAVHQAIISSAKQESMFVSIEDMMGSITKPDWLLKGILERGSNNLLFGESGAGKSLFAMDWAFCMAHAIPWNGHLVKKPLRGVIIMGEGLRGATLRFKALSQKYGKTPKQILLSRKSVNLLNANEADEIIKIVKALGFIPDYIIIDTLHRNMIGDENSSQDMALFFKSIEKLARELNAAILTVHHNGHGDKGRSRGSSSIKAAMDAEFCVTKTGEGVKFSCTKSKDFGAGKDMMFTIKQVELEGEIFLDDDTGQQITSVYLEYQGAAPDETKGSAYEEYTLSGLVKALETTQKLGGSRTILGATEFVVTLEEWRPHAYDFIKAKKKDIDFKKGWQALVNKGIVATDGGLYWIV